MTEWILKKLSDDQLLANLRLRPLPLWKDILLISLLLLCLLLINYIDIDLFEIIVATLSDAYLGVSIFIAATLGGFYLLDQHFKDDLARLLQRNSLQVPIAAFLGALPGCGGAIIVVTRFVNGQMSFGALVAVLISTMGDAAFLLISSKPHIALLIYILSLVAGIIFGYAIDRFHGSDYLRPKTTPKEKNTNSISRIPTALVKVYLLLLLPGTVLGILEAFQYDSNQLFGLLAVYEPAKWLGFIGAILCIVVWINQPLNSWSARFAEKKEVKYLKETVVAETSFVSLWVILGFLSYELLVYFTGLDLHAQFAQLGGLAVLLAIVIGFIPGCGPQIVVTTLYINGVVPFSAQLANAISNDGDALFPALALAPKAAFKATIYSAIPAFILGYGAYFLFEF